MRTGVSVFEVFHDLLYFLFVYASPGRYTIGRKEEIKSTENYSDGPLVHVADSKSYHYSWEAGQSGWEKPLGMAWLRQLVCCRTCVPWVSILLLLRDQRTWPCAFWNHCQFFNKLHWEQGRTQSTWQRRQWVGTYDAAATAEIYTTSFKDNTIVFLTGLP